MSRPNPTVEATKAQITDMFGQSVNVLAQPNPNTFERFERRGGLNQAFTYVMLAALVSAIAGALFAPFHADVTVLGQFFSRMISIPVQFFVFTGLVYLIGRNLFKGTGTFDEVAYSFALFYVPISILATLIGLIPIIGWLIWLPVLLALIFFGYFAVQSSMNLRDSVSAGVTLVLSALASGAVSGLILSLFGII